MRPVIGPKMRKFPVFTGNSPGQRTARDPALIRPRLLPGLVPGTRCQTGMGPEYLPGYRRLARHSLFRDKCGGWLAVAAVWCERVFNDFPVKQGNHLNMATSGPFAMQKHLGFQRVSRQFPAPHEQGI